MNAMKQTLFDLFETALALALLITVAWVSVAATVTAAPTARSQTAIQIASRTDAFGNTYPAAVAIIGYASLDFTEQIAIVTFAEYKDQEAYLAGRAPFGTQTVRLEGASFVATFLPASGCISRDGMYTSVLALPEYAGSEVISFEVPE